jgi:hypothetical protein
MLLAAGACATASADVVTDWNSVFIEAVRQTGGPPGPIARAGAIVHVSIYDAVNSIEQTHEPYVMYLSAPPGTSAEAAAVMAAHHALSALYGDDPDLQDLFDAQRDAHLDRIPDGPAKSAGMKLGADCAVGVMEMRADDGSDVELPYTPGANPGDWVPTGPDFSSPATPHWPLVTPWTMLSGDQFRPAGVGRLRHTDMAALLASPQYELMYNDVKELGRIDSTTRTPYQTETARFWANDRDGTYKPPGHLNHIAQVLAAGEGHTMAENARFFALLNLAMAEAAIVAWDAKYSTDIDLWRPVTGIALADLDGNPGTVADPDWVPLSHDPDVNGFTPPFPAWISGHATFGAVHAAILRGYYGTDEKTFTITSDDTPGVYRTYHSFSSAALENGRSRIYLGVHWQWDADDAYVAGTALGEYIMANFLRRFGDVDADGVVDSSDLAAVILAWGACAPEPSLCPADMNHDHAVDVSDLVLVLLNWG